MKTVAGRLTIVLFLLTVAQVAPFFNGNHPLFNHGDAWADEAQEMAERAPAIMQAAYGGEWQKVISMAKKDRNQLKEKDDMGWTVLHQAASQGNDTVVIELLKLGADKNARDSTGRYGDRPYDIAKNNKRISPKVLNMLK